MSEIIDKYWVINYVSYSASNFRLGILKFSLWYIISFLKNNLAEYC